MSLPQHYTNSGDYIEDCALFLQQYQFLYNFPNTDILVDDILDQIHVKNLETINVFDTDFDLHREINNDEFLQEFLAKIKRFDVVHEDFGEENDFESKVDVPLSLKKRHEIVYLANEIGDVCAKCNCEIVVDFGSGLGYLDQYIYKTTNLKVLGLECNENHYAGAKKRQRKYHDDSLENVKYIKHTISEHSDANIEEYLQDKFQNRPFCITGLHACADLTVVAIHLFLKMAEAKAMLIMPCCYHKMKNSDGRFENFPMSSCLRSVFESCKGYEYMRIPFLRLAAQPQCRSDDKLEDAVFSLLARAVLQLYARRHNCKLNRNKRKAVRTKATDNDFESYIKDAAHGFTLSSNTELTIDKESIDLNFDELSETWREISEKNTFKKAAIFILLQNLLQPVIENFVLHDRLLYLREKGVRCMCKKIFNEKTSPRCLALLAIK